MNDLIYNACCNWRILRWALQGDLARPMYAYTPLQHTVEAYCGLPGLDFRLRFRPQLPLFCQRLGRAVGEITRVGS